MKDKNPKQDLAYLQGENILPFPEDMQIETIEYFDNHGLMIYSTSMDFVENKRYRHQTTEFVATYVNGELGYFHDLINDIVLLDRTEKLSKKLVTKRTLNQPMRN